MFRRKLPKRKSLLTQSVLQSTNLSLEITNFNNNTSLVVNESETGADELPKELTSVLLEDEINFDLNRGSTSLLNSLSQKTHSTPKISNKSDNKKNSHGKLTKKNCFTENDTSYFEHILLKCGALPLTGSSSYLMSEDQAIFSNKIDEQIRKSPEDVTLFLTCFKEKIKSAESFEKMLMPTLTSEDCKRARGPVQESLIHMLLGVDCIQSQLISILLEKLKEVTLEENKENTQIISLILRQMRFLNPAKENKLTKQLFDIIQKASVKVQREIIFMLPEIISEDEINETSLLLIEMINYEGGLINVIIDAVSNLNLKKNERAEVRIKLLSRLDVYPSEGLPSLVRFILKKCDDEELFRAINGIREKLSFGYNHGQTVKEEKAIKDAHMKLTFDVLKFSVTTSKRVMDTWLKIISSTLSPSEFRCLDLIIIIIMYNGLQNMKNRVLTVVRKKIKSGILGGIHLVKAFEEFTAVLGEYFSAILEICSVFLKSNQDLIVDFGSIIYKKCFAHFPFFMKKSVINEILQHIGSGSSVTVTASLDILKSFCVDFKELLSPHTTCILGYLTIVPHLNSHQIRCLVDVVSELISSESSESNKAWLDEMQMFISKQLSSNNFEIYNKGTIAVVTFAKHVGKKNQTEEEYAQINSLLEMAMGNVGSNEIKRLLFNDEFANMILDSDLSSSFSKYWCEKFEEMAENFLFCKKLYVGNEDFPTSLQYSLSAENENEIVFPVVDFIAALHTEEHTSVPIVAIPSSLKLLWCCEKNIDKILNFFNAPVHMPVITVFDNFQHLDDNKKKKIMDSLFLCFNYLVECINAFCSHDDLYRAYLRLNQLIDVYKLIQRHYLFMSNYAPPKFNFYLAANKVIKKKTETTIKKGKKRKIDGSSSDSQNPPVADSTQIDLGSNEIQPKVESKLINDIRLEFDQYFRSLHFTCLKLLAIDLINDVDRKTNAHNWNCFQSKKKPEINTVECLFLLEDLVKKSEQILVKENKNVFFKNNHSNFHPSQSTRQEFLTIVIEILPMLKKKIDYWSSCCFEFLKANEGVYDSPGMFSIDIQYVKLALTTTLKFLAELLSWQGFKKHMYKEKLEKILVILSTNNYFSIENNSKEIDGSMDAIAHRAAGYLTELNKNIFVFDGALCIVKAVRNCYSFFSSGGESFEALSLLCLDLLRRPWFTVDGLREKGSVYNQQIFYLLTNHFQYAIDQLDAIKKICKIAVNEIKSLKENDCFMETLPTVHRSNFPLLYRAMCEALTLGATKELTKSFDHRVRLNNWIAIIDILADFVTIVKSHTSRISLAALLKCSQSVLNLFFDSGMPTVEIMLKTDLIEVLKLLRAFQTITRFLHSICCHSKITNDVLVATHVPHIRAQCERLTLEVKGMLIMNDVPGECITIGILKNKDLEGNDILSQNANSRRSGRSSSSSSSSSSNSSSVNESDSELREYDLNEGSSSIEDEQV